MGTQLKFSTANRPETDEQSERTNRTMVPLLRLITNNTHTLQKYWDLHLTAAEMAYNNYTEASTQMSPFELDTGYTIRLPGQPRQTDQLDPSANHYTQDQQARVRLAQD